MSSSWINHKAMCPFFPAKNKSVVPTASIIGWAILTTSKSIINTER